MLLAAYTAWNPEKGAVATARTARTACFSASSTCSSASAHLRHGGPVWNTSGGTKLLA